MTALIVARDQTTIDRMVSLIAAEGIDITGTTNDKDAEAHITRQEISSLVA